MSGGLLALEYSLFALALWLGFYLIDRNPDSPRLWRGGLGLVAYAASLAFTILEAAAPTNGIVTPRWLLLFLPSMFWTGTLIALLPEETPLRSPFTKFWRFALLPGVLLFAAAALLGDSPTSVFSPALYLVLGIVVLLPLLAMVVVMWRLRPPGQTPGAFRLVVIATLFFALSVALALFPLGLLPLAWLLPLAGIDLVLLGIAIAALDTFDQGEALLPDFIRSLDYSMLTALLFALPVTAVIVFETGATFAMRALLLMVMTLAIVIQVFGNRLQTLIDRYVLARFPRLQAARAELRAAETALPRVKMDVRFDTMDDVEFARLTRRAISSLTDLPKLAASPLTYLPLVTARLAEHGEIDNTLTRAAELKRILVESIERLRPDTSSGYRTTDEWRHFNALYFPYVLGLKPFSRAFEDDNLSDDERSVLEWFRANVPERTLHNWQTAAAKLVAQDLRERQQRELV